MRRLWLPLALIGATLVPTASASALPPPFGGLTPLPGTAGCVAASDHGGLCSTARGFAPDGYPMMAMSPDGRNLYTAEDDGPGVIIAFARDPASGALTQLAGTAGCVSNDGTDGTAGACSPATAIQQVKGVAVSPDGKNVYAAAEGTSNAVTVFSRDQTTGALTQLPGTAGCISEDGSGGACVDGSGLTGARGVTVSPDGANVYVASETAGAVSTFLRDPATGALMQPPGSDGCISQGATDGCHAGTALLGARDVVVSPDGANAYVAAENSSAVDVFQRVAHPAGGLVQLPLPSGCVAATSAAGCSAYPPIAGARSLAVSPDGSDLYVAAIDTPGVVGLRRGLAGTLTPLPGTGGCASADGSGGTCAAGTGLANANGVAVSPDGLSLYVASISATGSNGAVAIFSRDPGTGLFTQLPGTTGCLTGDGSGGLCGAVPSIVSSDWVTPSPDSRHIYVGETGLPGVTAFARELPPSCRAASFAVDAGHGSSIALACSDPNGDPLTLSIAAPPAHGALGTIDKTNGTVVYTPATGFTGGDSFSVAASDGSLGSPAAVISLTVSDHTRPVISRASISPRAFAVARARAAKVRRGAMIRYRLSEPATVTFTVQRKRSGRRVGKSCRAVTHKNRGKRKCTRYVKVGKLTQRGKSGADHQPFSGRIHRKALKPGSYRLVLAASDPSRNHSKPRRLAFRIVRAH